MQMFPMQDLVLLPLLALSRPCGPTSTSPQRARGPRKQPMQMTVRGRARLHCEAVTPLAAGRNRTRSLRGFPTRARGGNHSRRYLTSRSHSQRSRYMALDRHCRSRQRSAQVRKQRMIRQVRPIEGAHDRLFLSLRWVRHSRTPPPDLPLPTRHNSHIILRSLAVPAELPLERSSSSWTRWRSTSPRERQVALFSRPCYHQGLGRLQPGVLAMRNSFR